ncbi:MAG: PDZ domain-containing protein [Candidatus Eremiobacteraeota bacterium]|nr:PDZ domain-containing protein [Candidatus Eremiobacteraeota bacterium]
MDRLGYYRYATVARDLLVFACEDDLWSVPRSGGIARRLTASAGEISMPRLSPDATTIAFVGRDEGQPEVYTMAAGGGEPRRATFLGSDACIVSSWTPDGAAILFCADAGSPFARETQGFRIPAAGGVPEPLRLGHARSLSQHPDGRLVLGRNNDDPARWKRYKGGTAGDLWVEREGGTFARLVSLAGNPVWPMWVGERIFFLSDHEGVGNIYSVRADGGDLRRHTDETEYFVRFPSTDGTTIAYTTGARIALLDPQSDAVTYVDVEAPSTAVQTKRRFVEIDDNLEHIAPSPDGTALALVSRGRAFTMPLWEEAVVAHGAGSRVRYRLAEWLPDGERFVCTSDESGAERLEVRRADGEAAARTIDTGDIGRTVELAVSPSADVVALANHRRELLLIELDGAKVRKIDKSPAANVSDLAFSPDGRWLAYACATKGDPAATASPDTSIVRIAKVKSGAVHDVTPLLRVDRAPAWDPEGNFLYFISTRDFNPVYDALQFDLSFPQASRPFLVTLRDDVANPFIPKPAPLHRHRHDDDRDDDKKAAKPVRIDIDFEGIGGRILGFPVEEGNYDQIVAARGRALFTQFASHGIKPEGHAWEDDDETGTLLAYDFEQQRLAPLAQDVGDVRLAADGHTLVYTSHERLRAIDALGDLPEDGQDEPKPQNDPGRRSGWLDLSRASVEVEPRDEWAQMYLEAWRMQREQFWDESMSGVDWNMVRERYAKLLPLVRTRAELSDVMWEMFGELGTSHAYEIGGDHRKPPQYRRGFLGADLAWNGVGYAIAKIYRGDSWNSDIDSPLAAPGNGVREGDVLLTVGGRALSHDVTPDELLVNAAGRDISLGIASGKQRRRVVVRALRDERMLRYRAWVEDNRAYVHAQTGGTVGYLHIPDMGPWGFSEFHRGYLSEFGRDALLVDVRYNRGGHVSPLLLEKLARKRIGYDISRYNPPEPYPKESVVGPMVALTNQFAGSDGDIFSHAFKLYKLGPLVGKRTWGGVIGIEPYHRLVDDTITTQPEFSFWFVDVGWNVENYGTDPDYDIDIAPHDSRSGSDPQMQKALELLADLRRMSNGKPHFDARPTLAIPTELTRRA